MPRRGQREATGTSYGLRERNFYLGGDLIDHRRLGVMHAIISIAPRPVGHARGSTSKSAGAAYQLDCLRRHSTRNYRRVARISLPFKLLLFVLVDGWALTIQSVVQRFK